MCVQKTNLGKKYDKPRIAKAAAALGVSYGHLWRVIHGERESQVLRCKFSEYEASQFNPNSDRK